MKQSRAFKGGQITDCRHCTVFNTSCHSYFAPSTLSPRLQSHLPLIYSTKSGMRAVPAQRGYIFFVSQTASTEHDVLGPIAVELGEPPFLSIGIVDRDC
jgi:hypothetical protein